MDPRIMELLARLAEVTDDQLADLEDVIVAELETAAEEKNVETARELAEAIDKVRAERVERAAQAAARDAEIADIMQRVSADHDEDDADDDGDSDDDDGTAAADDAPASSDPGSDSDSDSDSDPDEGSASKKERPLPKISDLARKRTATSSRSAKPTERKAGTSVVVAATDVPGLTAGTEITDRETLRKAVVERWQTLSGARALSGRIPVAKVQMNYPDERVLRAGDEEGNYLKLSRVLSPAALVASGGICAPVSGLYDVTTLATGARPLRDSLPVFGAERGGIRFIRASSVSDVTDAITHITEAEDTSGTTKNCLTITCEAVQEVLINAVSRCLQFGNFNARTHPEYVAHLTDLTIAAQARTAEQNIWESMCDASTAVTAAENLSAWRDLYASVGRAAAMYRSRHRMAPNAMLRFVAPAWLADMLSIDLVRQMPGDNTVGGTAVSTFEAWLRTISVSVTWTLEGGTAPTQIFGTQGAGPLDGWPDTVETLLFPEGAFLFLDGGSLDLGVVRDSGLNATNDFQLFAETFENVAFMGPESLCLTMDLCPSGLVSGQDDSPLNCAAGVSS